MGRPLPPLPFHARSAVLALLTLAAVALLALPGPTSAPGLTEANIAVEHARPLTLGVRVSETPGGGLLELSVQGEETAGVSLPETWVRIEVRGVPLAQVTADEPALGYVRWAIPTGAEVQFRLPSFPADATLHNPSLVPLEVRLTRVDLASGAATHEVRLVQGATAELW